MTEPDETLQPDPDDPGPEEEEDLLYLTQGARVEITVGTQFTYRGNAHWPKVVIADGPLVVEDDDGHLTLEDGEVLLYRVQELAHRTLGAVIARMKAEIDERYAQETAARSASAPTQ